jgi:hypothetical protein
MNFKLYSEAQELFTNDLIKTVQTVLNKWKRDLGPAERQERGELGKQLVWADTCLDASEELTAALKKKGIEAEVLELADANTLGYGVGFHAVVGLPDKFFIDITARQFGKDYIVIGRTNEL